MIPHAIWAVLWVSGTFAILFKKDDKHQSFIITMMSLGIVWALYWWGGIFVSINWADMALLALSGISLGTAMVNEDKAGKSYRLSWWKKTIRLGFSLLNAALLYYAGFFDIVLSLM